mmetsp:Transcript_29191/g.78331  ORF Transcript_29191/g.78331 Transcript_29191/m.78331 type:complete len:126 (+) Transcript_29191:791-1168(+)
MAGRMPIGAQPLLPPPPPLTTTCPLIAITHLPGEFLKQRAADADRTHRPKERLHQPPLDHFGRGSSFVRVDDDASVDEASARRSGRRIGPRPQEPDHVGNFGVVERLDRNQSPQRRHPNAESQSR